MTLRLPPYLPLPAASNVPALPHGWRRRGTYVLLTAAAAAEHGFEVRAVQSNHEGVLIDAIHAARTDCLGVVINPGGLTHTSVALRDALTGIGLPFAEVHISDVYAREEFRHFSYLDDVAAVRIVGRGVDGYADAVRELIALIGSGSEQGAL